VHSDLSTGSLPTDRLFTGRSVTSATIGSISSRRATTMLSIGKFQTADTIVSKPGNPRTLNRYAYAANNPMRYTDPTGHYKPMTN